MALLTAGLTACFNAPDCHRADIYCVGLVIDTRGINDFGLNQSTWAGLERARVEKLADQTAYIESVNAKDYAKNVSYFVENGYDVIVTSGFALHDPTIQSAKQHPDSLFIGMNQPDEDAPDNFISVTFPEDRMGFFAGALATQLTQGGSIGALCETSGIDAMWRYCEGFRAGATYMDDSVKVIVRYRDGESSDKLFIDDAWGSSNAQSLIQTGVDVIFAAGGDTAVGALRAAGEAGVPSIGVERDQASVLGGENSEVVTSIVGRADLTIRDLLQSIRAGNPQTTVVGQIGYIPFDQFVQKSVVQELESLLTNLENGNLPVSIPPK